MIDKQAISDDLTDGFIEYQYRLENPMPSPEDTKEKMYEKYKIDHVFRSKVRSLVCGVMGVLNKHI